LDEERLVTYLEGSIARAKLLKEAGFHKEIEAYQNVLNFVQNPTKTTEVKEEPAKTGRKRK
jgi:hypothetical protein